MAIAVDAPTAQVTDFDPGLALLVLVAGFHDVPADPAQLRHAAALPHGHFSENDLVLAARSLRLRCRAVPLEPTRIDRLPLPAMVMDREGRHFLIAAVKGETALLQEAGAQAPVVRPLSDVSSRAAGRVLLFASRASLVGELARFDFSWFIPAIIKYRRLLLDVLGVDHPDADPPSTPERKIPPWRRQPVGSGREGELTGKQRSMNR